MIERFKELWRDESGISAVEYALLAAGIATAIIVAIETLGTAVSDKFDEVSDEISGNSG